MLKFENTMKQVYVAAICAGLTACGGGGGGSDPVNQPTAPGAGSTTSSAEATGTIQYAQYQATKTAMGDKAFATTTLSATAAFNASSKEGSIQFPVLNGSEVVSTKDGYSSVTWTGPFSAGAYRLNGNILMGCNAAAPTENQAAHVFVSSSLTRLRDGAIDELNGKQFDLIDCGIMKQAAAPTLTMNADGSMSISTANYTFPKNEVFNLLNPEKYSGALINTADAKSKGHYAGHAFRFNSNGVSKYAIVMQTNANSFNDANPLHYMLAIQR
jgi:hypothetical protein